MDRLLGWAGVGGWFGDGEAAVGGAGEGGGVGTEELAGPPDVFEVFLGGGREPVLPEDGADVAGRGGGEGVGGEESEDVAVVSKEELFGAGDDGVVGPGAEGCEPEIPVEARLVGGVDAGAIGGVLGLIEEGVGGPVCAVV